MSVIDDNWEFPLDYLKLTDSESNDKVMHFCESMLNLLNEEVVNQNCSNKGAESMKPNIDLNVLMEQNRQCKVEIDVQLEEINKKQLEYEKHKQDRKLLSQEIKETHEAFLMAKKYYKKFLKIYYTIEKSTDTQQTIFLQFFTESKKETENYSLRLQRDIQTHHYELLETTPVLKNFKDIQKNLEVTRDVPGMLSYIRDCFLKIKDNKK